MLTLTSLVVASIKWADAAKYWGEAATLSRTDGGMGLRELRLFFAQLDIRVLFLALSYWASGPFTCLKFLKESGRKASTSILFEHEHHPNHHPRPWEIKARTFKMKHPMVILPLKKKRRRRKKLHRSPFVPLQTLRRFWREGEVILCMCELEF